MRLLLNQLCPATVSKTDIAKYHAHVAHDPNQRELWLYSCIMQVWLRGFWRYCTPKIEAVWPPDVGETLSLPGKRFKIVWVRLRMILGYLRRWNCRLQSTPYWWALQHKYVCTHKLANRNQHRHNVVHVSLFRFEAKNFPDITQLKLFQSRLLSRTATLTIQQNWFQECLDFAVDGVTKQVPWISKMIVHLPTLANSTKLCIFYIFTCFLVWV